MTYDYVFHYGNRQLEIVTDTIADALAHLRYQEPSLQFDNLVYFINMATGERTPVFDKRKVFLDEIKELVKV
jgi:hypothetical protein